MKDTVVADEMKTAIGELAEAEAAEAALRDELKPLVEEKVAALMDGKQLTAPKERKISLVRARLDEATEIAQAKRQHVRQLHLLVVNKDVEAGRLRQREFVAEVTRESEKVAPLLRELEATRRRIAEIADVEYNFIRSLNFQLGLEGRDRLQERLRHNCGGILPPNLVDAAVFEEFASRNRQNLADF